LAVLAVIILLIGGLGLAHMSGLLKLDQILPPSIASLIAPPPPPVAVMPAPPALPAENPIAEAPLPVAPVPEVIAEPDVQDPPQPELPQPDSVQTSDTDPALVSDPTIPQNEAEVVATAPNIGSQNDKALPSNIETPTPALAETPSATEPVAAPTLEASSETIANLPELPSEVPYEVPSEGSVAKQEKTDEANNQAGTVSPTVPPIGVMAQTDKTQTSLDGAAKSPPSGGQTAESSKSDAKKDNKTAEKKVEYFDSPPGEALKNLPPPSINPMLEPGESIIIVNKAGSSFAPREAAKIEKSSENTRVETLMVSGQRALALGKIPEARQFFDQAYRLNSSDPTILMGRAITRHKMGERASAIAAYEDVLSVQPNNAEAIANLMGILAQDAPEQAINRLLNLQREYPNNASLAAQLAVVQSQLGDLDSADRNLALAINNDPENSKHYYNRGLLAEKRNNRDLAISMYEKALEADAIYGSAQSGDREKIYDRLILLRR
jgi:Flp pilus assembly protein TadD